MKIPSQMYPVIFLLIGIATFVLADHAHSDKVLVAMVAAASSLIGAAQVAFQHESKSNSAEPTPAADQTQKPPV